MERKLATIRRIAEIKDIPGADLIQAYRVDGWWVVDSKGKYQIGTDVVYCEVDSWIPHELAPFLSKGKEPREYNGVKGERLRTIKLKGQLSQGLLLPINGIIADLEEGDDVTELLGIQKWERPIPAQLRGLIKGNFPSCFRKTDQERIQNCMTEVDSEYNIDTRFEVTIKLDGSSLSVGMTPDLEYTVCSRNLSLKTDDLDNAFVKTALKYNLEEKLKAYGKPIQISGEMVGLGIQGNPENLSGIDYYVFDIFDPIEQRYLGSEERLKIVEQLGLNHVPILYRDITLQELDLCNIDRFLEFAEGKSLNSDRREGVVFKSMDGQFSFKAIANSYLLKEKD